MSGPRRPYLSLVVVGRNDGYGGDFLGRLQTFVRSFMALAEERRLPSEICVIEWNPPADRPPIGQLISTSGVRGRWCSLNVISVPAETHARIVGAGCQPLLEYSGKNIGIRRAAGDFVLATNPDVILSSELVRWLARRRLSQRRFYRIDRWDVRPPVPEGAVSEQLRYCAGNVLKIHARDGSFDPGAARPRDPWFWRLWPPPPTETKPHLNGAGDFLLMSRRAWASVRGFAELEKFGTSHHIDALAVYEALYSGYAQTIIPEPARLYHQDHSRPDPNKPGSDAVNAALDAYRISRSPQRINADDWGSPDADLPTCVV